MPLHDQRSNPAPPAGDLRPEGDPAAAARADAALAEPPWWGAVLALRAAFRERPDLLSVTVPLGLGALRVDAAGAWAASALPEAAIARELELYIPYCLPRAQAFAVAHIGQSLDGRIAAGNGESRWVTGAADLLHCHRMRALCDAVVVGARTVRADDPQLTVRHCRGNSPVRVVIDPDRRLGSGHAVFREGGPPTLVVTAGSRGPVPADAEAAGLITLPRSGPVLAPAAIRRALRERGLPMLFVEGGGVTVSHFLEAGCLDHLQIAVAPIVLGSGPPGLSLPSRHALDQALRPRIRRFDLGADTLFDCAFDG